MVELLKELYEIAKYPNANGILEFVIGFLLALSAYHAFLYVQNRDKVYLYYSLYTFLTIFGYFSLAEKNVTFHLIAPISSIADRFDVYFKFLYNAMYFVFAFEYAMLWKRSKKWYLAIFVPMGLLVLIGTVAQVISLITWDNSYIFNTFHLIFIPGIFIPTGIGYFVLFKYDFIGRSYIIIGSLILFVTSMLGVVLHHIMTDPSNEIRYSIFYFGVIIENIFFSLGLGFKSKKEDEERNKREHSYLQQLITIQEEERENIARELHDGIVQEIGSVILGLRLMSEDPIHMKKEDRQSLLETLENSNRDLRTISHQMMPRTLSELGLVPATKQMLQTALKYTSIQHTFESFNMENRPSEIIEVTLYRIIQELVSNLIKHSNAKNLAVQLYEVDRDIMLIFEDDGVGLKDKNQSDGIGFHNIKSRLELIKGKLVIDSVEFEGTLVTIKIPL